MEDLTAGIVGQWQLVRVTYQHKEDGETAEEATDDSPDGNIVVFNDDGTGVYDDLMTWALSGGELVITDDYGTDRLTVENISDDGLELSVCDHYEEAGVVCDDLFRDTYRRVLEAV